MTGQVVSYLLERERSELPSCPFPTRGSRIRRVGEQQERRHLSPLTRSKVKPQSDLETPDSHSPSRYLRLLFAGRRVVSEAKRFLTTPRQRATSCPVLGKPQPSADNGRRRRVILDSNVMQNSSSEMKCHFSSVYEFHYLSNILLFLRLPRLLRILHKRGWAGSPGSESIMIKRNCYAIH